MAALHREYTAAILAKYSPARRAGSGRPSSAVLGSEYGLPRAKRRSMVRRIMGSLALPSALLRFYSSPFFPPIAVSVVPPSLEFPDFPFVKAV